jgi:AraC-like DNA-binding protein
MPGQRLIEMLLLALAMGAMLSMAAAHLRARQPLQRWIGVMFDISVFSYALKLWNDCALALPHWLLFPCFILSTSSVGWFQLFVIILFDDARRLRPIHFLPAAALAVLGFANYLTLRSGVLGFAAINLIQIGLIIHVFTVLWRGWKGDLVEARRRMRGPFLAVIALYILTIRTFENLGGFGIEFDWWPMVNAGLLAAVCLGGSLVFIEARAILFGPAAAPAPPPAAAPAVDRAVAADLARLEQLMTAGEVWREEGLTIASLALKLNMSETQLRRLINDHLGHRNFPAFVNARRIAAARSRLSDPVEARVSISAIAFDIGFGSLGPFNRAFREATGKSPSEWRREALNGGSDAAPGGSPIPEGA